MRLLLTSNGLTNDRILDAFNHIIGRPASELRLAFVPTATNLEDEDKSWVIDNLYEFRQLNFAWFDIVDIAALSPDVAIERIDKADVLVVGGGMESYLLEVIEQQGLLQKLDDWLSTKVYIGISAGSDILGSMIYDGRIKGLEKVPFAIVPHKASVYFPRTEDEVADFANEINQTVYWLDDDSAVMVDGGVITCVGSGKHQEFAK